MLDALVNISRFIGSVNERTGRLVAWLTAALTLLFCYDVTMRYLFDLTRVWIIEMEWHLFSLIFLMGAGYALKHDRHVRVDVFYAGLSDKKQAWINLTGTLLFLIPWCLVVISTSFDYAHTSFIQNEGSPNPGGLPYRFVVKSAITVGFILLLLQGIGEMIAALVRIAGRTSDLSGKAE